MVLATVVIFLLLREHGETLAAPAGAGAADATAAATQSEVFLRVLVALAAIVVTGQVLARVFARIGQPPVIGEVVAGILLGPSLLGPEISGHILPDSIAPSLGVIAQLGVVLYMFLVGLELDVAPLRRRARATIAVSHASILIPFLCGSALALPLYPRLSNAEVPFTSFALFLGVAMSITAFPVLARILGDSGIARTRLGVVALAIAAIGDVTAWCLLAFVVGVAQARVGAGLFVVVGALAFVAVMLLVVRPAAVRLARDTQSSSPSSTHLTVVFVALLVAALAAEAIGIHAIFGAFLLGAVIPHDSEIARGLKRQIESLVSILLLPAFFAFTGMRTQINLLTEPGQWAICAVIALVAVAGKLGGTLAAARATGYGWRDAAILGTLMNTRGLMELIVLNVGLDLGIISLELFAMMVVMALVTTAITAPALRLLGAQRLAREI
jgi:Kef-type K+ transport system membrane component KefB